jgi:hypothetical protein
MTPQPLLLTDYLLLDLAQDSDLPLSVVSMEEKLLSNYQLPPTVEVLNREEALNGLRKGRFSRLLMSPRRSPFWDKQRPFVSRVWEMRKKIRNDSLLRQYEIPKVAISCRVPLSVVDRSDTFHIPEWDHPLLLAADAYWMREIPIQPYHVLLNTSRRFRRLSNLDINPVFKAMKKVRSISLGVSDANLTLATPTTKRHDIFFSGTDTSPWREQARQVLHRLKREGQYRVFLPETPLSRADFYRACAESYLVVSPSGLGWDCYRHYEAALCGSVPVMNYPTIRRHHPFTEGEHGFYYDLEDNGLERCLRKALIDRSRLLKMGEAGRAHVIEHHLNSKILRLMLTELA